MSVCNSVTNEFKANISEQMCLIKVGAGKKDVSAPEFLANLVQFSSLGPGRPGH